MLGTFLWNTGALGSVNGWNLVSWVPDEGSKMSSHPGSGAIVEAGMHTPELLSGKLMLGYLGDFYYRFHITTLAIDIGNLVSDQVEQVTVWNAHRRAWIMTDLDLVNAEGIEVTGQPDPPLQFAPLQERTFSIGIFTEGPARIDATIAWTFSSGEVLNLAVLGQRVVLWNWKPNWAEGLLERIQWHTNIIQAGRGEEQRRSLRIDPRQFLEFSSTITEANRRIMETALWGWGARPWAVPLWQDGQQLTAPLSIGATVVPVSPVARGFAADELLVLTREDPQDFEVIEVASLSSSITLARATQKAWPAGTWVYPARVAVIENAATVERFDGTTGTLRLQWRMLDPLTWAAAATPTYRSLPVFEHLPNWVEDPSQAFDRKLAVLDAGTGTTEITDHAEMPLTLQRMRFTLTSKAQIDTWKKRLWTLRGKQGAIWVPTWAADLKVAATVGDNSLSIDVEWTGYTKYIAMAPGRRDIRILTRAGAIYYRRITGAVELSAAVERLSIDTSLGVTLQPADIAVVSYMALSRSESDIHEFSYFTGDAADTAFSARAFRTEQ